MNAKISFIQSEVFLSTLILYDLITPEIFNPLQDDSY